MTKTSRTTSSKFFFLTALVAFTVGYQADPFKKTAKPDAAKIQAQYPESVKSAYNKDGAMTAAATAETSARVPASLRDAYANAKLAFKKGHCREVQENLERLSKNFDFEKIVKDCEQKSANNANTEQNTQE